jgi:hypothetical protein
MKHILTESIGLYRKGHDFLGHAPCMYWMRVEIFSLFKIHCKKIRPENSGMYSWRREPSVLLNFSILSYWFLNIHLYTGFGSKLQHRYFFTVYGVIGYQKIRTGVSASGTATLPMSYSCPPCRPSKENIVCIVVVCWYVYRQYLWQCGSLI